MSKATRPHCHVLTVIDGISEEVIEVTEIPKFELEAFARQFDVPTNRDPQMLDRYAVGPDDVAFLERAVGRSLSFDFARFGYFIEAVINDMSSAKADP